MRVFSLLITIVAISAILGCSVLNKVAHDDALFDKPATQEAAIQLNSGLTTSLNAADDPKHYVRITDKQVVDHPLFNSEQSRWLLRFNDPVLVELVQQALENSLELKQQAAKVKVAKQAVNVSGSGFYPSLQQDIVAKNAADSALSGRDEDATSKTETLHALWQALNQQQQQANIEFAQQKVAFASQVLTLTEDVAEAWYTLSYQFQQLTLYQQRADTLSNALKVLEQSKSSSGLATTIKDAVSNRDINQREADTKGFINKLTQAGIEKKQLALQQDLVQQQELVMQQIKRLASLTGTNDPSLAVELNIVPPLATLPGDFLPSELISREPDLQIVWLKLLAENAFCAASHKARFPSFLIPLRQKATIDWRQLAQLIGPLPKKSDSKRSIATETQTVEQNRSQSVQLEREYLHLVFSHFSDLEHLLSQEQHFRLQAETLSNELSVRQKETQDTLTEYKQGSTDLETLLKHQEEMLDSQARLLALEHKQRQNRVRLNRLLGGIPDVEINRKQAI